MTGRSKNPPAKPEAFPSLAPQRGLSATERRAAPVPAPSTDAAMHQSLIGETRTASNRPTPWTVKLWMSPRQSRGFSRDNNRDAGTVLSAGRPLESHFVGPCKLTPWPEYLTLTHPPFKVDRESTAGAPPGQAFVARRPRPSVPAPTVSAPGRVLPWPARAPTTAVRTELS